MRSVIALSGGSIALALVSFVPHFTVVVRVIFGQPKQLLIADLAYAL
jgi:hypothetical protein